MPIIFTYTVIPWCHYYAIYCLFSFKGQNAKRGKFSAFVMFCVTCMHLLTIKWLYSIFLLLLSSDVEINPGTRCSIEQTFSTWAVCQPTFTNSCLFWEYILQFTNLMWNCLSETYWDTTVATDDENLRILDYNLVRPDHLADTNRGGICLYYKTCFPFRVLDIQCLNECINFDLKIGDKLFIDHLTNHRIILKCLLITLSSIWKLLLEKIPILL